LDNEYRTLSLVLREGTSKKPCGLEKHATKQVLYNVEEKKIDQKRRSMVYQPPTANQHLHIPQKQNRQHKNESEPSKEEDNATS